MRRLLILLFAVGLLLPGLLPLPALAQGKFMPLTARCDRPNAVYKVGETVTFRIARLTDQEADYDLSEDGLKTVAKGPLMSKDGKVTVTGTLKAPGFLFLRVKQGKGRFQRKVLASAAFEPEKIEPTARMPADFDAFWEGGKKELAKVPMDAKVEHVATQSDARVDCYKISLGNVEGKRVRGWLSVPKGKGPFPAILTLPRAGVPAIKPDKESAYLGALSLRISIHDLPVDEPPLFYHGQSKGALKDYADIGMDDKSKSYFRAVILGCLRCNDYLCSRTDFNGKDLAVKGAGQGGALAIVTSGLDPRVQLAVPSGAALCDHSGLAHGRVSGWPHWLNRVEGERRAKVLEASAYFDAVNFARKFKGKSLYQVIFIDTACAPTTVYAAFNVQAGQKTMIAAPRLDGATAPRWAEACIDFWKTNLALRPPE